MIQELINRPCQIIKPGEGDPAEFGSEVGDEETIDTVCEFQASASLADAEDRSQNNLAESKWNVFFLPGTNVEVGDVLRLDGVDYEIDGEPWEVRNPLTRQPSHIEVGANRVAGSRDGMGS